MSAEMPWWWDILLKLALNWSVLALSFYITLSLFWLGGMVLLIGNRKALGSWLTGGGLLLGALFFTSHTAILGRGLGDTGLGMNFWWWVSWTPAAAAPLAWYGAMLWHTGYRFDQRHPHRVWIGLTGGLAVGVLLMLGFANPVPSYQYVAGRFFIQTASIGGFPLLILLYLAYSILCYLLPLDLLNLPQDQADPFLAYSRRQARPWLMGASLAMFFSALLLAYTAYWALSDLTLPGLADPAVESTVKQLDLAVSALVAIAVTLLGRAIVAYEVFTGRVLPRDRFTSQWRGTVLYAAGFGMAAAGMAAISLRPIYALMVATALATVFYILISWRAYAERETLMARLRPFLAGQDLLEKLATPQPGGDPALRPLFETLARDLLEARGAALVPAGRLAALAGPPLVFPEKPYFTHLEPAPLAQNFSPALRCRAMPGQLGWAVPLWSQNSLAGVLYLGAKRAGGPYSEEEIELAQAGGERVLDRMAGAEVARLSLELLRRRLGEARVLEGQGRRVLHDEVLPELHTALLEISTRGEENREAVEILSRAHRRISDLLRSGYGAPDRLGQGGLLGALRGLLENDFAAEFARVEWVVEEEAGRLAAALPPFAGETVYFAARELVRNAGKYAGGGEAGRAVALTIRLRQEDGRLRLEVEDDGVGPEGAPAAQAETGGRGGDGLRIHSAMLAAAGGSLEIVPAPAGGTLGTIVI